MSSEQIWLAAGGALALLLLVAVLTLGLAVRRLVARVTVLEAERDAGRAADPDRKSPPSSPSPAASYVITALDEEPDDGPPVVVQGRIDGALFADIVAREGVVKAAGLVHGVRRALAPESRNRIRFEVRREVKRSRKQRRADLKAALRDMQARDRARTAGPGDEEDAA